MIDQRCVDREHRSERGAVFRKHVDVALTWPKRPLGAGQCLGNAGQLFVGNKDAYRGCGPASNASGGYLRGPSQRENEPQ